MIENAPYKAINNACINIMSEALYLYINWYGANQFNGIRKKPQIGIPNEVNTRIPFSNFWSRGNAVHSCLT